MPDWIDKETETKRESKASAAPEIGTHELIDRLSYTAEGAAVRQEVSVQALSALLIYRGLQDIADGLDRLRRD